MVFEKKHYLFPLATAEILMNPALEQNRDGLNYQQQRINKLNGNYEKIYLFIFMLMCIVSCEKPEEGLVAEKKREC